MRSELALRGSLDVYSTDEEYTNSSAARLVHFHHFLWIPSTIWQNSFPPRETEHSEGAGEKRSDEKAAETRGVTCMPASFSDCRYDCTDVSEYQQSRRPFQEIPWASQSFSTTRSKSRSLILRGSNKRRGHSEDLCPSYC